MIALRLSHVRVCVSAVIGIAGCFGHSAAFAEDCKLSVQASPRVLLPRQRAQVNVLAHFPSDAYAFAGSQFDVHATHPMWTFASSGAIIGNDVMGMDVSQPHAPQLGIFANPSNPYRVWHGTFTPADSAPALVRIDADPATFSYYPSQLTSSTAECDAVGGSDWIFVNPLSVGRWAAAPGPGTTATVQDDVIVDGRIITGDDSAASVLIGLLQPAILPVRESQARIAFSRPPVTFTATVQVENAQRSLVRTLQVTFDQTVTGQGGMSMHMTDGSVRPIRFEGYLGGISVATGDLDGDEHGNIPSLTVDSAPQTIGVRVGAGTILLNSTNTYDGTTVIVQYDQPIRAVVGGRDGRPRTVILDTIEARSPLSEAARRAVSTNNLKQIGLGCHNFEAVGVRGMTITPTQPR